MEWSSSLQRQRSCACPVIDIGSWCNPGRRRAGFTRRFADSDYDDDEFDPLDYQTGRGSTGTKWRGLWRRIVKEKRKIFDSGAPRHTPYDLDTYAQNFDQGSASFEPENLPRSFSARFAGPSRIFQRHS